MYIYHVELIQVTTLTVQSCIKEHLYLIKEPTLSTETYANENTNRRSKYKCKLTLNAPFLEIIPTTYFSSPSLRKMKRVSNSVW